MRITLDFWTANSNPGMLHDLRRRESSTGRCNTPGFLAVGSRYGRGAGVGRGRGVGVPLGVGVGVAVGVGVGPPCAQYLPPVLK